MSALLCRISVRLVERMHERVTRVLCFFTRDVDVVFGNIGLFSMIICRQGEQSSHCGVGISACNAAVKLARM